MRKHITKIPLITLVFLVVAGCNSITKPGPRDILSRYLEASLKGYYEEAYHYVSSADKAVKNLESYLLENKTDDSPLAQVLIKNVSFKILDLTETDGRANATVEITIPDIGIILKDIMGAAFKFAFGDADEKQIEHELAKKYESGNLPLTTKKEAFQLVKEKDGWRVYLDWKSEQMRKEKEAKIRTLLAEAKQLKEERKLHGALQKYQKVLELDSELIEAKESLEETKKEIKSFEEKQAYMKNVLLYDLKARYYDTYLEENVAGVEFKLKNKGNRTLKEVEVTVYFKDGKGTIIAEKTYHPVLVTKYSFSGDNKPLKPNYIWQLERGKFYKADSVPSEWKEGLVSAKVTNIEFED